MKPAELIAHWNKNASGELTAHNYAINLPLEDAAKIEALALMYPKRTKEQLITDLLTAALYELEESMPYIKGEEIIEHDEQGDAIYADKGPTTQFLALANEQLQALKALKE
ncbi:MAG TPA: type 1 pili tip component [Cellvibrionaceae bacterium]